MLDRVRGTWLAIKGRKAIFAAAAAAAALGTTSVAQAHDHHWKKWRHYYAPFVVTAPAYSYYTAPSYSYYGAPPVVYAPRPVPVYPEPMTYAPAYPSYSYVAPPPGVNFNFTLPLR